MDHPILRQQPGLRKFRRRAESRATDALIIANALRTRRQEQPRTEQPFTPEQADAIVRLMRMEIVNALLRIQRRSFPRI